MKLLTKTVQPGESISVPLRWNNPHASEMEVNVWIFEHGDKRPVVVRDSVRDCFCSGVNHGQSMGRSEAEILGGQGVGAHPPPSKRVMSLCCFLGR